MTQSFKVGYAHGAAVGFAACGFYKGYIAGAMLVLSIVAGPWHQPDRVPSLNLNLNKEQSETRNSSKS
jgi:hypothetical protein